MLVDTTFLIDLADEVDSGLVGLQNAGLRAIVLNHSGQPSLIWANWPLGCGIITQRAYSFPVIASPAWFLKLRMKLLQLIGN